MSCTRFIRLVAVSCVALILGCGDTSEGDLRETVVGRTMVDLLITDPDRPPDELAFNVDFVSYRIVCPASGLTPYDDSVDISGYFEIVDERDPPIFTMTTDLPPGNCIITMWVFHEDEVVCSGSSTLQIVDGGGAGANQFSLTLVCNLSANPPSGDADVGATFDFVAGNFCPQLIWLGAVPSVVPPGPTPTSAVQVFAFDEDGTCGLGCDPQTCDFQVNPPLCTPGPDPGMSTTFFTDTGTGTFDDVNASDTNFNCDPLAPGPHEVCVTATDGDVQCDQTRCTTVVCP